jgi:hypothetical protein
MNPLFLRGVGVVSPGFRDWDRARLVLCGRGEYCPEPLTALQPVVLPLNERRRATDATRVALEAAHQAAEHSGISIDRCHSVFASADGDTRVMDRMCETVARDASAMSPTLFHNSVHNAVAGYWSIGSGCTRPSTSLSAGDGSFAAGLLEGGVQLEAGAEAVLLVAYDLPAPEPLHAHRPLLAAFGCAMVLGTEPGPSCLAVLDLSLVDGAAETPLSGGPAADLEPLRSGNPAARSLPLLRAVAAREAAELTLPYLAHCDLRVLVEPHRPGA